MKKKPSVVHRPTLHDLTRERKRLLGREFIYGTWIGIIVEVGIRSIPGTGHPALFATIIPLRWRSPGMWRWRIWVKPRRLANGHLQEGYFKTRHFGTSKGVLPGHDPMIFHTYAFGTTFPLLP